jgi:hypothetical protein
MADYIEEMRDEFRERYRRDMTPNDAANAFALHNFEARIQHLKRIKAPEAMSVRETADRLAMERAIRRSHDTLQKVGR